MQNYLVTRSAKLPSTIRKMEENLMNDASALPAGGWTIHPYSSMDREHRFLKLIPLFWINLFGGGGKAVKDSKRLNQFKKD